MAIRYNDDLNSQMRRIVRNYNKRMTRLEKTNFKNVPERVTVRELKQRYSNRADLMKELNRLKSVRKVDILRRVETEGGIKAVGWKFDYVKDNLNAAKEYLQREYERVNARVGKYPGERMYVDNISAKINFIERDLNYMSQSDFETAYRIVDEFAKFPSRRKAQYRGFLKEVEWVMDTLGYKKEEKDKLFNKFYRLTPSQFLYAYEHNDIIASIYRLYHKDFDDEPFLTLEDEDAQLLIEDFIEQVDDIIKDAKANMD